MESFLPMMPRKYLKKRKNGPENAPMEVHLILLGAGAVLLEGIRLAKVSEGVYFLNAAPLNLSGADGSPCRAILIAAER